MSTTDRLLLATTRFLLASAFIGMCLLCQAATWLGYLDWWLHRFLTGG